MGSIANWPDGLNFSAWKFAGMDTRVYRLNSLQGCSVFEVDFAKVLDLKDAILDVVEKAGRVLPSLHAKHVERVAADVSRKDWFGRLEQAGFDSNQHTVWILEGLIYYLKEAEAKSLLEVISSKCRKDSVLLADFMNESSTHLGKDLKTKFYFHSDWPEQLLPHLGYSTVKVSQIGDTDANFGLVQDELHIFNQIRKVPRDVLSDDAGRPYHRLLLVESTVA
jgi:methyltransferase (TIGR00027 family)